MVRSPVLPPVNVPVPTINLSALSSNPINALFESPLSITIPASFEGVPVVPVPNSISGSAIVVVVELTVVVVPLTVKFPDNVTLPENVCPAKASDLSSAADTAFAAIWSAVTANFQLLFLLAVLIAPVASSCMFCYLM